MYGPKAQHFSAQWQRLEMNKGNNKSALQGQNKIKAIRPKAQYNPDQWQSLEMNKGNNKSALQGQYKTNAMSQSLSKLYVHVIFHVKHNEYLIRPEDDDELYTYIGCVIKLSKSIPIIINGIENHIHVLCIMSKTFVWQILWKKLNAIAADGLKTKGSYYQNFAWQGGYTGFSVSPSIVEAVKKYIANQKSHHQLQSVKDEYIQFLNQHGVDYNAELLRT